MLTKSHYMNKGAQLIHKVQRTSSHVATDSRPPQIVKARPVGNSYRSKALDDKTSHP
jgi:hypothetical protein